MKQTATPLDILVTGGTGYIGRNLNPLLLARGHRVRVLTRAESAQRVPAGATSVVGDALSDDSVAAALPDGDRTTKNRRCTGDSKRVSVKVRGERHRAKYLP